MKKTSFVMFLGISFLCYALVSFLGPVFIRFLFDQGRFDLLNRLTLNSSVGSLGFYLGRGEELFWGPLAQVIGGIILAGLVLGPFKDMSSRRFFLLILGFLIVTKWNVLTFPPYGDSVGGPFAEGWWLAQNNFNYVGLFQQPGYALGGPKVYFFSIFPTYLAVLMKLIPSVKLFLIVNHLVFFSLAAGIVMFLRDMARRVFCVEVAGLLAVLVLSWPVFQSQAEAINMELPCLFFAAVSSWALVRDRINLAGVMALTSLLVKGVGAFACAAFLVCGIFIFFKEKDQKKRWIWILWGIALFTVAVLTVAAKFWIKDQHASAGMIRLFAGWPSLKIFPITYVFLLNLFALLCLGMFDFWQGKRIAKGFELSREAWRINLIHVVFAAMWFLLFLNFYAVSPRYRVSVYPFFLFALTWTFVRIVPWRIVQIGALVLAVLVVQFNSYGMRHCPMETEDYVLLEENLQYRNDLVMYQHVAKIIEEKYSGTTVVAPFIMAQTLAIPWFGYVKKERDVVIYGFNCTYGGIRSYPGMQNLDIPRTIYVAISIDRTDGDFPYPIHPKDKILETVEWGNKKAWIFMGGISIDMMKKLQEYMMLHKSQAARNK